MSMPSAAEVLKEVKKNHAGHFDGSGSDMYVPKRNIYPHLHVTKDFVVYSTSSGSHKDLVQGGKEYASNLNSLVPPTTPNYATLRAVLDYMAP
jgi:hypothetical protein